MGRSLVGSHTGREGPESSDSWQLMSNGQQRVGKRGAETHTLIGSERDPWQTW